MGVDHHHHQQRVRDADPHACGEHNPRDNTDTNPGVYAHSNATGDDAYTYAWDHTYTYAGDHAYSNATGDNAYAGDHAYTYTGANFADADFDTNTKPKSGPTGAAQQPLDSDASPDG
jgi:hypothetical protein